MLLEIPLAVIANRTFGSVAPQTPKSGGERLELSETWCIGDAAGLAARDCGSAGHPLRSLIFLRRRTPWMKLAWTLASFVLQTQTCDTRGNVQAILAFY